MASKMKLSSKYILFVSLLHSVAFAMSFAIFREYKLLFIISEVLILVSLYFSYRLYRSMVEPIRLINRGINAIRDRDFTVKFQGVGQFEIDGLIQTYNQMIDQLREERLEKTQKHFFLEKLINSSPTGVIILNLDGEIATCNPIAQYYLKSSQKELQGYKIEESEHPLLQKIASISVGETRVISLNGLETYKCHKAQFIDRGFANYFIMLEELTAEKLAIEKQAYGKVIRMMAHEVNNSIGPINSILKSLSVYKKHLPEDSQADYEEVLAIAHQRNDTLNDFMRNFASVVKIPEPIKEEIDLRPFLERMANFMSFQTEAKQVDIKLALPGQAFRAAVDPKLMEQVLINILKNAIEAITEKGQITLHLDAQSRKLRIIDSGHGIKEDDKIFSPFFSSKKNGQGIGLTLTREILQKHGFAFSLQSHEAGGAVFEISF
ncbi:MAG: ATP-binding protein [Bacteroidota bacterium]